MKITVLTYLDSKNENSKDYEAVVPQVAKAWRRRSVNDLSLVMLLMFATGVALWLVYGFLNNAMPIIVANGVTLVLALWLIGMKMRFR